MQETLNHLMEVLREILGCEPTVYLYGSCVLDDFCPGWSDIDLLVLTSRPLTPTQLERLVPLRQAMLAGEPGNPYYRAMEGAVISAEAFLTGTAEDAAYWGTSGERIRKGYALDCFSQKLLMEKGELLCGEDIRHRMRKPTLADLRHGVAGHLNTLMQHGKGESSLYAYGWLLDTARCLYTLRTGDIIAKTDAGKWALQEGLCPDPAVLKIAVAARQNPAAADLEYACTLTDVIQRFAKVLLDEL